MALLEVCVDSLEGLREAERRGASRIELCSRLDLGGLSPDPELLDEAMRTSRIPIHAMVRPRAGGFVLSRAEVDAMEAEIRALKAKGVAGIVLGALTRSGEVDSRALVRLLPFARPMSATFHRAFDEVADPYAALEELVRLGFERVLTSGGAPDAYRGRARLAELVALARGRIVVMAGGGVRAENAAAIVEDSGVEELHGSVPFEMPAR